MSKLTDTTTAPAIEQAARSASGGGATNSKSYEETDVDYIPFKVSRLLPWKPTEQVIMPYYQYSAGNALSATAAIGFTWRLNSVNDVLAGASIYSADPAAAAQTGTNPGEVPMFRDYWFNFYKYFTVVKCEYRLRVRPGSNSNVGQMTAYLYEHGQQFPPLSYSSPATLIPHHVRLTHPGMRYKHILTHDAPGSGVDKNYNSLWTEFYGTFTPGSIKHEVEEDAFINTWTKTGDMPAQFDLLTLMVQPSPVNAATVTDMTFAYEITMKYYVQLKDLYAQYQYPTPGTSVSSITNFVAVNTSKSWDT